MTKIEIIDYPVFVKLGCFEAERLHGQEVLISLEAILAEERNPGTSDELSETIDYGSLLKFIDDKFAARSVNLIETILNELGRSIIVSFETLKQVNVSVEKTILPDSLSKGGRVKISGTFFPEE